MSGELTVIVLAAGGGTRMKSKTMKVLHPVAGRSMVGHVLAAVQQVEPRRIVAVVGHQRDQVGPHIHALVPDALLATQEEQHGTGHAVRVAMEAVAAAGEVPEGTVLVAYADTPLLEAASLRTFAAEHEAAQRAVSILSGMVADPYGYGRVVRNEDGEVEGIVEEQDATDEQRAVREINSGILAFDAAFLIEALPKLSNDNAKGEYYLTDTVHLAREAGLHVGAHEIADVLQTEGVNDRVQLARTGRVMNERIVTRWMEAGVSVMDPATTWVDADVVLNPDVTLLPGVQLLGATVVEEDAVIGPDTTLKDCEIGAGARVIRTHGELAVIGGGAERRPVRLPASGHHARHRRQDRHLRRDQERPDRRRRQGAAPVLRRRRRDRRGQQHRRRHDLRQLRRRREAPHRGRPARQDRRQQHLRGAGGDRRRRRYGGRHRRTPRRPAGRPRGQRRAAAEPGALGALEAGRDRSGGRGGGGPRGRGRMSPDGVTPAETEQPGARKSMTGMKRTTEKNLMVFSGRAHPQLAEEVTQLLGTDLVPQSAYEFANSEIYVRYEESVRGCDAFVLQSHTAPINEWIMEHLIMVDALKRASAKRITVVMPFYGYARQDKKHRGREPISARLMADLFKTAGADRLITVDLHADQIQGFFDGPVDHLMALPILADHVQAKYGDQELAVVSPDAGRIKVAERWASRLGGVPLAFIHKTRNIDRPNETVANRVVGDVKGRMCVLVDDMIDTGGTITKAAEALMADGAAGVVIAATHAILSEPAVDRLKNCPVEEVVVTNTLPMTPDREFDKLTQPLHRAADLARDPRGVRGRLGHLHVRGARLTHGALP